MRPHRKDGRDRRRGARPESFPTADDLFGPIVSGDSSGADARPSIDTHADQLCAAVADALCLALATARDAALRDLGVVAVTPRRGSACLQVVLSLGPDGDLAAADAAVRRAHGWLRSEVGDAIERKRVPELVVHVVPYVAAEVGP